MPSHGDAACLRLAARAAAGLLLAWALVAAAAEPARHALLIGNARYEQAPLRNPEHDAADLGAALRDLGFKVTLVLNADRAAMQRAVSEYARQLDSRSLSLVYFGGHGVQAAGRNYLLPILPRARAIGSSADLPVLAVPLETWLAPLAAARPRFNLVVLDACRDDPFGDGRQAGGLAPLDAPPNTLIAFATSPGKVAYDGAGRNGTYTAHLLRHLARRDLRIEELFKLVRAGVLEETRGRQLPWENTALTGELALALYPQVPAPAPGADSPALAWIGNADEAQLRRYLAENRDPRMRALVTRRLVAVRERAPVRRAALEIAERDCEACPQLTELALPAAAWPDDSGAAAGSVAAPVVGTVAGPVAGPVWASTDLVSTADWRRCVAARACALPPDLLLAADHDPAQGISAAAAEGYVAWLNTQSRRLRYFLPTEAQWLAVYRASFFREGGRALFGSTQACSVANLYDEAGAAVHRLGFAALGCNDGFAEASPVGLFSPSLLGLFDLVGNLWQWTSSCAEGAAPCRQRRLVGGSWATGANWTWESPPRLAAEPDLDAPIFGLRVFARRR